MEIRTVRPLADAAITFELADRVGPDATARVRSAAGALDPLVERGELPGAIEVAQAFCSITLHYDPLQGSHDDLVARVRDILAAAPVAMARPGRSWRLPCCYEAAHGIDLANLSARLGLSPKEIVEGHAGAVLEVYALGFLPGLPFLGQLPDALALPRREEPRSRVPAGSVGIAGGLSVIYPVESPGGWHIVGRCPLPLFDIARMPPALLRVGDRVTFEPVAATRLDELTSALTAGETAPESFLEDPA